MYSGKHQCHMAASCTYHLPTIISLLLNKSHTKNPSGKKSGEWTINRKMTRHKEQEDQAEEKKNKRGDRKGESNDSPEIPDRRETSDIPGLPSGDKEQGQP